MTQTELILSKTEIYFQTTKKILWDRKFDLSPAGEYFAYILTYVIIINRLKAFGAFYNNSINTEKLTEEFTNQCLKLFTDLKSDHNDYTFNNFRNLLVKTYYSDFFKNNPNQLAIKTVKTTMYFETELSNPYAFNDIFITLYIRPFFSAEVSEADGRNTTLDRYIRLEDGYYNHTEFKLKIIGLIDRISEMMNNDSYFISQMRPTQSNSKNNPNCYIATLAYGDINHQKVIKLREFRDAFLMNYWLGKKFVNFYYRVSPGLAIKLRKKPLINLFIKKSLDIIIPLLKKY